MEHRHEVVSGAQLLVAREDFFSPKMSEAVKTDLMFSFSFCEIVKLAREV